MKKKITSKKVKYYLGLIDKIEKTRTKNNINWMNVLRLAIKKSPIETVKLVKKINLSDQKISKLLKKIS